MRAKMPMNFHWLQCSLTFMMLLSLGVIITGGEPLDNFPCEISELEEDQCPDPDEIEPCMCYTDLDGGINIDCSNVKSEAELRTVFSKNFNVTNFSKFSIHNNRYIKVIKEGDLGNSTFETITIATGVLSEIEENALMGSRDTLIILDIENNRLTSVPDISNFTQLEGLFMFNNNFTKFPIIKSSSITWLGIGSPHITEIPVDALKGLPSLQQFHLEKSSLTKIYPGTFENNKELFFLSFVANNLTTLPKDIKLHGNRTQLWLRENQITHLPPEVVSDVTLELVLSNNSMTEFPENVFKPLLEKDVEVFIYGNPFDCECDIAWLILNQTLLLKLPFLNYGSKPTCSDGVAFVDLDPEYYMEMCSNITTF